MAKYFEHNGVYEAYERQHTHNAEKVIDVSVEFEIDRLWIQNRSDQFAFHCLKVCFNHHRSNWILVILSSLDHSSATEQNMPRIIHVAI